MIVTYYDKGKYQNLVKGKNLPIFYQPWYLNAVCGKLEWSCFAAEISSEQFAVLVGCEVKYENYTALEMPPLTQYAGPYICLPDGISKSRIQSAQNKLLDSLFSFVEKSGIGGYAQKWSPWTKNWLVPYWRIYEERSRLTYVIDGSVGYEEVYGNYSTQVKNKLKKNQNNRIVESEDAGVLYEFLVESLKKYNKLPKFSLEKLSELSRGMKENHAGKTLFLTDEKGKKMAAALFLEDSERIYYYIGGTTEQGNLEYGPTLLIDRGIQMACEKGKIFDFAGSMLPGVSRFYRNFGADLESCKIIYKAYSEEETVQKEFNENYRKMIFKF